MGRYKLPLQRVLALSVVITTVILSIFVLPDWFFLLLILFFTGFAMKELYDLILKKNIPVYKKSGILAGLIIPAAIYFNFSPTEEWVLTFLLLAFISFFILEFLKKDYTNAIAGISITVFVIIYVSWLFSYMVKIKQLPYGSNFLLFLILVTKLADSTAYFIGKRYGRHKLLKRISPKKSIEGAIGGFCMSVLVALLSKVYLTHVPLLHLFILGCLCGVAAQLGDLSESLIKRDFGAKDSGVFIPEQGGVLDLIDSILFSAPILYLYVKLILQKITAG